MQDPMQSPEQNPGPDPGPGPNPGEQPGPAPGQLPGPGPGEQPGPAPGQFPGPGPGPNPGPMPGQKAGPSALSDPPSARPLRMAVIALGALSLIFLIAGTAVDEYTGYTYTGFSYDKRSLWYGCQNYMPRLRSKYHGKAESLRLPFKYMNTLSFVIILTTSFLCLLQVAATGLNVVVLLLGKLHKGALVVSSILPFLLLLAIVMANINFSGKRFITQVTQVDVYKQDLKNEKRHLELGIPIMPPVFTTPDKIKLTHAVVELMHEMDSSIKQLDTWGSSYDLICAAFAFAVINQILLIALHKMAKNDGVATFGAFVKTALKPAKIIRVVIFLVNLLMWAMMYSGTLIDGYIDYVEKPCLIGAIQNGCNGHITHNDTLVINKKIEEMEEKNKVGDLKKVAEQMDKNKAFIAPLFMNAHTLAIVLFALTSLVCLLLFVATVLSLVQIAKDKNLSIPLLGMSGVTALLLIISVVLACVEFKASNHEGNILIGTGALHYTDWNARHNITEERSHQTHQTTLRPNMQHGDYMSHRAPQHRFARDYPEPPHPGPELKWTPIEEKVTFAISFHLLATALAFALVNAGLTAASMCMSMKEEKGSTQPGPGTMKVSSTQLSSTGAGAPPPESTCKNPTEATCQNPSATA